MDNQTIRKHMRQKRRALTADQRQQLSLQLADHFTKSRLYRCNKHIAFYLAADGELDLLPIIQHAWAMKKKVYLPVLHAPFSQSLFFAEYKKKDRLGYNRYGIGEPMVAANKRRKAQRMDLVLTPLVAFDKQGNRVGMGAGYYDRTFSFLRHRQFWLKPHLVGVGYAFQEVESIQSQPWDIPLHSIATESELIPFSWH